MGDRTIARRAFTIWRETVSGVDSAWHEVIVFTTRSTSDIGGAGPEKEFLAFGPGDGGGDCMLC